MLLDPNMPVRKILAIRMDNIGDLVMLSPALRELKRAWPQAQLTLLTSTAGAQVAPLLPWVDKVIPWRASWQEISANTGHSAEKEYQLVEILKSGAYDAAFIFTSFSQSPYPPAYVCFLAGIPIRVGQSREFGGVLLSHWIKPQADNLYQSDRSLHLLRETSLPVVDDRLELHIPQQIAVSTGQILARYGIDEDEPFIVIAPGASAQARRYPPERFAQAAQSLVEETGLRVLILGSPKEAESLALFRQLAQQQPRIIDLIGSTTLPQTADLVRRSTLVIANNSAALHLAESFNRPMVILYSGTETISQWAPKYAPAVILNRPVDCSPCYRFTCPYLLECLDIDPRVVTAGAIQLLSSTQHNKPLSIEIGVA